MKTIALIGYRDYAHVAYDCFFSQGQIVTAYSGQTALKDPFGLRYLGPEPAPEVLRQYDYFVTVADNALRSRITATLVPLLGQPLIALHKSALLSRNIMSGEGVMIGPRVVVNAGASLGDGVVLHTGCIVDYGARIDHFASVGAGTVIGAGAVVETLAAIGAGAVLAQGVRIGAGIQVPDGAIVTADMPAQ